MKTKFSTIILAVLAIIGVVSLTSNPLSGAAQNMSPGGEFPFNWATSGTFDTATNNIIVSATTNRVFLTEIGFGEEYNTGRTLTLVRASGEQHRIADGLGTQDTVNNAAASLAPAVIKFTCSPILALEPGDSIQALNTGGQGYWSGYTRP